MQTLYLIEKWVDLNVQHATIHPVMVTIMAENFVYFSFLGSSELDKALCEYKPFTIYHF